MWKKTVFALCLLGLAVMFAVQQQKLNSLNRRLNALPGQPRMQEAATATGRTERPREGLAQPLPADRTLNDRLSSLESAMLEVHRLSDYLMERGMVPLHASKIEEVLRRIGDPNLSEEERLRALRLLRSGNTLNEQAVVATLN